MPAGRFARLVRFSALGRRIGSGGCQAEGHRRGLARVAGAVHARATDPVVGLDAP
jgi:hypothetical protein